MSKLDPSSIGRSVAARRTILRLSQKELSELSGVSIRTIGNCETDKSTPSIESVAKLASALNCTVDDLLRIPD